MVNLTEYGESIFDHKILESNLAISQNLKCIISVTRISYTKNLVKENFANICDLIHLIQHCL